MLRLNGALLKESEPRSTNEDRRAEIRIQAAALVRCLPKSGGEETPWLAQVKDISTLGIGLVLDRRLDFGDLLEIELTRPGGGFLRAVMARCVHVEDTTHGTWIAGCAFVQEWTADDLEAFQAKAMRGTDSESRRWTRFSCNVETVCTTSQTAPGETWTGRILNVSPGGIGLLLSCQFEAGTLLSFDVPGLDFNHKIMVRVVRSLEHGQSWFHGCEFADRLTDEELQEWLN